MSELNAARAKRVGAIRRDLLWVCDRWEDVYETRLKGTPRPWREPTISSDAREEIDRLAKAEKLERDDLGELKAPGETTAPVHVDVLDTLADMLMRADTLHEHVAQTLGVERLPSAPSAFADPSPYLRFISDNLTAFIEDDPDGMDAISDRCRAIKGEMSAVLGEVCDGQTLAGMCPFCGGKDDSHPVGGAKTLRVKLIWMPSEADRDHHEPAIVCGGGRCEPSDQECGLWIKGLPHWPMVEWEWLGKRFEQLA